MNYRQLISKKVINKNVMSNNGQMKYPKCSNDSCTHNDRFDCKANGQDEDIICKQGKAEAFCSQIA